MADPALSPAATGSPTLDEQIAAARDEADTYPTPEHGWVCFHCGEAFPGNYGGMRAAREHFGALPDAIPACHLRVQSDEKPFLRRIRILEKELSGLRATAATLESHKRALAVVRAVRAFCHGSHTNPKTEDALHDALAAFDAGEKTR